MLFMNSDSAVATGSEAPATKAPAKKRTAKKPAKVAKKKTAKKVAKKKAAKKSGEPRGRMDDSHDTIRLRMFKLLKKHPNGLMGGEVMTKLELTGIPNLLRDEGIVASPPRIKRELEEGKRGVVYTLTAAGKKALENGTVNSGAPGSAKGLEWK